MNSNTNKWIGKNKKNSQQQQQQQQQKLKKIENCINTAWFDKGNKVITKWYYCWSFENDQFVLYSNLS